MPTAHESPPQDASTAVSADNLYSSDFCRRFGITRAEQQRYNKAMDEYIADLAAEVGEPSDEEREWAKRFVDEMYANHARVKAQ